MNYYKVIAVRGHVGAGRGENLIFAIEAETMYEAMQIAKRMPMVKHKSSAIKACELISKETFDILRQDSAYKNCKGYKEK